MLPAEQAAPLKLLEKGVSKEALAGLVLLEFPCELASAVLAGRWASSPTPFTPFMLGYKIRLVMAAAVTLVVRRDAMLALSVCLSVCPSVRLSVCQYVRPSVCLSVCLFKHACMQRYAICIAMGCCSHSFSESVRKAAVDVENSDKHRGLDKNQFLCVQFVFHFMHHLVQLLHMFWNVQPYF